MKKPGFVPLCAVLLTTFSFQLQAQLKTNTAILQRASVETAKKETDALNRLVVLAGQKNWALSMKTRTGGTALLVGVDFRGRPRYKITNDNIISAATIKTNLLWPGGSTGLNLSGASSNMDGKLAIWDGGRFRTTHAEFTAGLLRKMEPQRSTIMPPTRQERWPRQALTRWQREWLSGLNYLRTIITMTFLKCSEHLRIC